VSLRKVVLDSNVYIGWLNAGLHEGVVIGPGLVRYLSAVVLMEPGGCRHSSSATRRRPSRSRLRCERSIRGARAALFDAAGRTLRRLKERGREIRRSSLVSDVLIAHTARSLGAAVVKTRLPWRPFRAVVLRPTWPLVPGSR
jgi:predicted nucleic acid-binding protein